MELTLRSLAFAAGDKSDHVPLKLTMLRQIPGPDREDYWIGELHQPFNWTGDSDGTLEVSHLVLATQWEGTCLAPGVTRVPVGIAYVVDESLLQDDRLDVGKIRYVATGVADDPTALDALETFTERVTGAVARAFSKRTKK